MTVRMNDLAPWSRWFPFERARTLAPWPPDVYVARRGHAGPILYVGMAGLRGLHGRLNAYATGRVSGLAHAA